MEELWDLYNLNRERTGKVHQRGIPIQKGFYHIVVEIWTIVDASKILITQRHKDKPWGLLWECTGGSILKNETSISGAIREVKEEIGLEIKNENIELIHSYKGDETIYDVYCNYIKNEDIKNIKLQEYETIDFKIVTLEEFNTLMINGEVIPKLVYINDLINEGKMRLTTAST